MSDRVEIRGFGPVTVRGLSKGRVKRIREIENDGDHIAEIVKRGLVKPKLTTGLAEELGRRPEVLEAIVQAIKARSWPEVGV